MAVVIPGVTDSDSRPESQAGEDIMTSMSWFVGAVTVAVLLLIYWGTR